MKSTKIPQKMPKPEQTETCSLQRMGLCTAVECDRDCAEHYDLDEIIAEVKSWG